MWGETREYRYKYIIYINIQAINKLDNMTLNVYYTFGFVLLLLDGTKHSRQEHIP